MKSAFALGAIYMLCSLPVQAADRSERRARSDSPEPMTASFDLAKAELADREEVSAVDPEVPRGMDLRAFAWDPPALKIPLSENGPVLAAGAMGARFKDAPKLAHIAIGWDF